MVRFINSFSTIKFYTIQMNSTRNSVKRVPGIALPSTPPKHKITVANNCIAYVLKFF